MNYGYTRKYREITHLIKDNRNARDIFDYLCSAAAWGKYTEEIKGTKYNLETGQLIINKSTLADQTCWHENRKKCTYTDQEIKSALNFLVKQEVITKEPLPAKAHGFLITVICYTEKYMAAIEQEPQPTPDLEPEGIEAPLQPTEGEQQPEPQPEPQPTPCLEPQGMKQALQPEPQPRPQPTFIIKELKEKDLKEKDLKDIKSSSKIPESNSIVNTFQYIFKKFSAEFLTDRLEPNQYQVKAIRSFAESMDLDLLKDLLQEAGEGSRSNPASYFLKICREWKEKGVRTLDEKQHFAAQYNQAQNNRPNKPLATRRGIAVPEGYYDDLTF